MRTPIDRTVFEGAVRAHHADVYRSALRITRDESTALDAVQETFRRVLEGEIDLSSARDIGLLLRCAAARQALMSLRSERARARREVESAMMRPERYEDRRSADRELADHIERALNELPHELRTALVLRFREGLTFAQVSEVLSIAEPSAFERVQRGLDKLRNRLSRLGFAPALADLGELLGRSTTVSVPSSLENQLIGLGRSSLLASAPLPLVLVALAIAGAASVLWFAWFGPNASPTRSEPLAHVEASTPDDDFVEASSERRAVDVAPRDTSVEGTGAATANTAARQDPSFTVRLEGVVIDALSLSIAGANVAAHSVRRDGKFAVFTVKTTTDRDGRFSLDLPIEFDTGEEYTLEVHTGTLVRVEGRVRAMPHRSLPFKTVRIDEEVADRPGEWEVRVTVLDDDGTPLAGALVRALRPMRNSYGQSWLDRDDAAETDANGVAVLSGVRLGPKCLFVDARAQGWAPWSERLELPEPGQHLREIRLVRGLEVRGSIVDHQGRPCARTALGGTTIALFATADDSNERFAARVDDDGHFTIPALAAKPHRVRFQSDVWSPFTLHDVRPGGEPLTIELKPLADPTERGTHDAELHGRIFDAASAEPIALKPADVSIARIPDDSPALRDGDLAPLFVGRLRPQVFQSEWVQDGSSGDTRPERPATHAFALSVDEPGLYVVCVDHHGFAPTFAGPFALGARDVISGIDLQLERGERVTGFVHDGDGRPLSDAWVVALGQGRLSALELERLDQLVLANSGRGFLERGAVRTDAQGRFAVDHLPNDRGLALYVLHTAFKPQRVDGSMRELSSRGESRIELRSAR